MQNEIKLLTFTECRKMLRIGATTLYALLRSGAIEHYKAGGKYLIPMSAIIKYLDGIRDRVNK